MHLNKLLLVMVLLLCLQTTTGFAQRTIRYSDKNLKLKEAIHYVDIQNYQQAHLLLNDYLTHWQQEERASQEIENQWAEYYFHVCELKLEKPFAESNMKKFLRTTPFNQIQQIGNFQFAKYYYARSNFDLAIRYYEICGINCLTNQELAERNFELGYSYLVTQRLDKVEPYFKSAKNIPGDYFKPGNYYHGILSYYKKNYKEAAESFNAVKDDARYKKIIPFYLTEIEYITGDKEKALKDALTYLKASDKLYFDNELNLMVAHIYCEQEEYAKAEAYYKIYMSKIESPQREDFFKLAYCVYKQNKIEEAIPNFEAVSKEDDFLSQQTDYLLGKCYLLQGDKEKAYDLFSGADTKNLSKAMQELYTYTTAKLSYENGDIHRSISQLNTFVTKYPESLQADEANELLVYLNMKDGNFDDALFVMNRIKKVSEKLKHVYQKANYARGIQMLKEENVDKALFHFQETKKFQFENDIPSQTDFWMAECYYRLGKYPEAMMHCNSFMEKADTSSIPEYTKKIHLTKAYVYLQNNDTANVLLEYPLAVNDTTFKDSISHLGLLKPNFSPEKVATFSIDTFIVMTYDLPEQEIDLVYKPIPLKPLALNNELKREDQTNFIQAQAGNLSAIDLRGGVNLDPLLKTPFYLDFTHSSVSGKKYAQQTNQTHVGVSTTTEIYDQSVELAADYDRNKQYYYGFSKEYFNYNRNDIKQTFQNMGVKASLKPLKKNAQDILYKANFYAGVYNDKSGAGEFTVKAELDLSKQITETALASSDIIIDGNFFFVKYRPLQNNSLISWRPCVTKQLNQFTFKTGLYPTIGTSIHLLPDITIQYPLKEKLAIAEIGWQSKLKLNTFKQTTELNPFIFNDYHAKQSVNTELFAGVKGDVSANLSYAVRGGIAVFDNLPLFVNDTAYDYKQFAIIYEKRMTSLLLDASINYTINREMYLGGKINLRPVLSTSKSQEAWHYVPSFVEVYGKINIIKDLVIGADFFMMAGAKALTPSVKSLASGLDMNISIRYAMTKRLNALLDINNLFGSHYERWYGYPMYGTYALAGLSYSFKPIHIKQ